MSILVIGSTGQIGSQVVLHLVGHGVEVRALSRHPALHRFPEGVTPVKGDLTDIESMREALAGVTTLFLLNPVVDDELTRAQLTLNLAVTAGIQRLVYFSMKNSDTFADVPHATAKFATEQMITRFGLPATILRPNYFMQNDANYKAPLLDEGRYPMPIGGLGTSMADIRDIGEVAARLLLRRENSPEPLPSELIELSGADVLTGSSVAAIWAEVAGRPVAYMGDDVAAYEKRTSAHVPNWLAYDNSLMFRGFQRDGMVAAPGAVAQLTELLGRPPRTYRDFAQQTLAEWRA